MISGDIVGLYLNTNASPLFLQNHLDLIVALEEDAIILPKEEEAYILKTIAENKANTAQRLQGWENVAKFFA